MAIAVKRETRRDTNISLDKPIYTISVASEILETHPRTLMMYEHLGLVVPKRTSTNRRRFSQRDVMKLQTIQKLTRQHSVNLAGVRYIMKLLKLLQEHELPAPVELRDIDVSQLDVYAPPERLKRSYGTNAPLAWPGRPGLFCAPLCHAVPCYRQWAQDTF